jgi:hypothetical protein
LALGAATAPAHADVITCGTGACNPTISTTGPAIKGESDDTAVTTPAILGWGFRGGIGVQGETWDSTHQASGVVGLAQHGGQAGVYGYGTSTSYGVYGVSGDSDGVLGTSTTGNGVYGFSTNGVGVYGATFANVSGAAGGYFYSQAGSSSTGLVADNGGNGTGLYARSHGGNAGYFQGNVFINGNANVNGALTFSSCPSCTSDVRLKKNVAPLTGALDQLLKLKGVTFEWKEPSEHEHEAGRGLGTQTGFIAQDVEKVFPNWVKQEGYTAPDGQKYRTLELRQIEALEVESIRALKAENDALTARVRALEEGRRPVASMKTSGFGFGLAGLAIAGAIATSRRKRDRREA